MSEEKTYYEQRLPDLIKRLKSQVNKNMKVITLEVESELEEDKYHQVLKGRRMAIEYCISTMHQIDKLEQELNVRKEDSYYKEMLTKLIECIKEFVDLNLEVIDIEVEDEYPLSLDEAEREYDMKYPEKPIPKRYIGNIAWVMKKLGYSTKLSEEKFHNVLKARQIASVDTEWALKTVDNLTNELNGVDKEQKPKQKSWAKVAAEK